MIWVGVALIAILFCFGGVLIFGAPYLPTMKPQVDAALKLVNLKPGDTILELGSGDGKVLIAAAKKGINSVGYELNPLLVVLSWIRTRKYRKNVKIIWGNFFTKEWPNHQAIFTFLLPRLMQKLDKKVIQSKHKPVKLVSFAFEIPNRKPIKIDQGVYLYLYK